MNLMHILVILTVGFVASYFSNLMAMGTMHAWLKDKKELFGFTKGVQNEFDEINRKLEED